MNYIKKFELPLNIDQYIDFWLIFNDFHIDNLIIASDIELNSYILNYFKSYQLSQSFVFNKILKVFHEKFYK